VRRDGVTLAGLLGTYTQHVTPTKSDLQQREDRRRIRIWLHVLGDSFDPLELTGDRLREFERARRAGTLRVPGLKLRKVRAQSVRADLAFLRAVCNWAASMQSGWLLPRNPMDGYDLPAEVNPRRPRLYYEDYIQLQAHADEAHPRLPAFLQLVESLGWRVSAVCQLRVQDYDPEVTATRPYGRLLKRAETDKMGVERWTTLPREARDAIEAVLPGRRGWLFPAEKGKGAWSRHYVRGLLLETWDLTEVPEERFVAFHAFRRKWVDERDHLPDHVVAAQGAWLNVRTLDIYREPSEEALMVAATNSRKLRRNGS
jgi:integrase